MIGISFQIYDDVLDLITPEETLGKARGSDLREGKKTLIAIHAFNQGIELDIFGRSNVTQEEIDKTVHILEDAGSIQYAKDLAMSYLEKGKSKLEVLEDSEAKQLLLDIADYMVERPY